jgi:DNA / pantothenate metabolism flavoprotein
MSSQFDLINLDQSSVPNDNPPNPLAVLSGFSPPSEFVPILPESVRPEAAPISGAAPPGDTPHEAEVLLDDAFPGGASEHVKWNTEVLREFVAHNSTNERKLVVITSGGTTVSLERNVVRFLDNFSTGVRGSTCAEVFLTTFHDYGVVFLGRRSSKMPFTRHLADAAGGAASNFSVHSVSADKVELHSATAAAALQGLRAAERDGRFLLIEYVSVQEYLFSLQQIAEIASGPRTMFVLAAAVSDFYVPLHRMSEHKIQSVGSKLVIEMEQVPKCLGLLRRAWAPASFLVSFKVICRFFLCFFLLLNTSKFVFSDHHQTDLR